MSVPPLPSQPPVPRRLRPRRRPRPRHRRQRDRLHSAQLAATAIDPAELDAALDQLSREWQIDL